MSEQECHVCGKKAGFTGHSKCRICGRYVCLEHIKGDVCVICQEKLGNKENVYFISAWLVAVMALLALIFLSIGYGKLFSALGGGSGMGLYVIPEVLFLGLWGFSALLYWSGKFKDAETLATVGKIVAFLALVDLIVTLVVHNKIDMPATIAIGDVFRIIFLGVASTLSLLRLSGKLGQTQ